MVCRITALMAHLGLGWMLTFLYFPFVLQPARARCIQRWSRIALHVCGLELRIYGKPVAPTAHGGVLWVANHVSWLDILVLNSLDAPTFVAKAEIAHWPVLGRLSRAAGTLFIERTSRHAVRHAIADMRLRLTQGARVMIFPEGTTGDGVALLPFHANLFAAVWPGAIPIQPLAIRYRLDEAPTQLAAFVGQQTMLQSLCLLLGQPGLAVELTCLPHLPGEEQTGANMRHTVARTCAQLISACLASDNWGSPVDRAGVPAAPSH